MAIIFWVFFILAVVFTFWEVPSSYRRGVQAFTLICIFLLGLSIFGSVHGL